MVKRPASRSYRLGIMTQGFASNQYEKDKPLTFVWRMSAGREFTDRRFLLTPMHKKAQLGRYGQSLFDSMFKSWEADRNADKNGA